MFAVTNASRTLTAKWIENTYTITIQPNGETITGKEGETINIASYVKRPTLTFDYGYDSKISSITPGAKIECTTGKINIKSEEEIMYTVGGSDATVTININSITLETPESREGYEFEGWYTEKENGSKVGNAGDIYDITANTTIYAHWKSTSEENIPVESIELDKNTAEIYIGGTVVVKATVKPDNSTNKNVRYTSSDEDIATVSQAGIITGKKAGAVTITVTTEDGNKTAECTIIVKDKNSENPEDPNDSDKTEPIIDKVEVGKDQDGNNILYITATDGESGISKVVVNGNDITEQVTEDGKFYCILNKDGEYEIYVEDRAGNSVSKFLTWKTPSSDNDDNNSGNKDDDNNNNDNNDNNKDNNNEKPGDNNSNNNSSNSINNNSTGNNNYGNSNNIGTNNSKNQISGSTSNDSTTANKVLPKTGNIAWIVSVVGIIAIGIISIIKYKKTDIK